LRIYASGANRALYSSSTLFLGTVYFQFWLELGLDSQGHAVVLVCKIAFSKVKEDRK